MREHIRGGGKVIQKEPSVWHLEIPSGPSGKYRLAQLDDYSGLSRRIFPWIPPLKLSLRARTSAHVIPGTWGVGLWNDPFGIALVEGSELRFPKLPNTAWFFFASPQNYLSLRNDLPGNGQMAATFRSPANLPPGLIVSIPLLPLIVLPPVARWMRQLARRYVQQDTVEFDLDPTKWHKYEIDWLPDGIIFLLDGKVLKEMRIFPRGRLGMVIWIDNQYASLPPNGHLQYGTLANDQVAWLELEDLNIGSA